MLRLSSNIYIHIHRYTKKPPHKYIAIYMHEHTHFSKRKFQKKFLMVEKIVSFHVV